MPPGPRSSLVMKRRTLIQLSQLNYLHLGQTYSQELQTTLLPNRYCMHSDMLHPLLLTSTQLTNIDLTDRQCNGLQAQHDLSNAYYSSQQYHDWWNHYVQYYGQYPPDQPAPQYGYAAAAPQISPAPWAPAASLQPAVLPAPAQQAPPTMAIQQPAVQRPVAQQHTR